MTKARVLRIYAGGPGEVTAPDGTVLHTALFKQQCEGPVRVTERGVEGDGWGSPEVHGLPDQALCLYPVAHWPQLRAALADARGCGSAESLRVGAFGENLAVDGADEASVRIASVWRWGAVRMQVTMPRAPCATLTQAHGLPTLAKEVSRAARTGWYCRVLEGGVAGVGDALLLESVDPAQPTVAEAWRAQSGG